MSEEIKNLINKDYQKGLLKKINNILITEDEIAILKRNNIDIYGVCNMAELLVILNNIINDLDEYEEDFDELVVLYDTLRERNYYFNTNK